MIKQDRIKLVEEMLANDEKDPFLNFAAALEYNKIGDKKKAINLFMGIVKNNPEYLGTYYQLGKLFDDAGQIEDAIITLKEGRKIALQQNDQKTLGELTEALMLIDEDFDGSVD